MNHARLKQLGLLGMALAVVFSLLACTATPNYLLRAGPQYSGSFRLTPPATKPALKIVTWNIQFARRMDEAIDTFRATPELQSADIILLQEMDAVGVEALARALHWSYLYYPASVHSKTGRDFGEAILSPWPLSDGAKVLLPNFSPRNGQIRIAVRARVHTPSATILAYSAHTETAILPPEQRQEQLAALLQDVPSDGGPVIITGDFNTITPLERQALRQQMARAHLQWLSAAAGPTTHAPGLAMDYIFARGFHVEATGVVPSTASDHLPLWVVAQPAHP